MIYILSLLIQLIVIVHILKTGRPTYWVFIVFFGSIIGILAYLIVEILPSLQQSPTLRRAGRSVGSTLDPNRDLRNASRRLEIADTAQNALAVSRQLLSRGEHAEAKDTLERAMQGIHADDPELLMGLAEAHLGLEQYAEVIERLDHLKTVAPDATSGEGHLMYARAKEGLGNLDAAIEEYEALQRYYSGPEPACRLGTLLMARGDEERARELFSDVLENAQIAGKHYRQTHREWISQAREALNRLS
ncbi:MAG: tetratricopeptide repeat protein [Pseudomonadota bacterium]